MQVVTISITLLIPGSQKFQMDVLSPKIICCNFGFAPTSEAYKALLGVKGGFLLLFQEQGPTKSTQGPMVLVWGVLRQSRPTPGNPSSISSQSDNSQGTKRRPAFLTSLLLFLS